MNYTVEIRTPPQKRQSSATGYFASADPESMVSDGSEQMSTRRNIEFEIERS